MKFSRYLLCAAILLSFLATLCAGGAPSSPLQRDTISFNPAGAIALVASDGVGQDKLAGQDKPAYQPDGSEGEISGSVLIEGDPPPPKHIDMGQDPDCQVANPEATTEDVVVNGDKLANVLVYVEGNVLDQYSFDPPDTPVTLHHTACEFSPRVVGLVAKQYIEIVNDDATTHNTHAESIRDQEWNFSMSAGSEPVIKVFTRPEIMIPVRCNQHPWERAYIGVLSHPFFSVTGQDGSFTIRGLPPGNYRLMAWHEKFGSRSATITIKPGDSINYDFTFNLQSSR
ncbi:MAG TPA: carboxypeptidase regulatory-like domain-containing protein [Blastocatellia bacterium]